MIVCRNHEKRLSEATSKMAGGEGTNHTPAPRWVNRRGDCQKAWRRHNPAGCTQASHQNAAMNTLTKLKLLAVDAWPSAPLWRITDPLMEELGLSHKGNETVEFLISLGFTRITHLIASPVSVFLAAFYRPASDALFSGADKCVVKAAIRVMKKRLAPRSADRRREKANELSRRRQTKTVYARSLSKNHDWNTVK